MIHRNPLCQSVQQYRGATDYGDLAPQHSREARTPIQFFRGCIRNFDEVATTKVPGVVASVFAYSLGLNGDRRSCNKALRGRRDGPAIDRRAKDSGLISHT